MAVFIPSGSLSARGVHLPRMGGALIQLHPGLEIRHLCLDRYLSTDLGWQKSWLYVSNKSQHCVTPSVLPLKELAKLCYEHHVFVIMHMIKCVDQFP